MRALPTFMLVALVALAGTAHADPAAEAARVKLVSECDAFAKDYDASRSPKLLANLGLCGLRLERDGDAIDAYSRYLHEDPDLTGTEHDRVVHDLQSLDVSVGYLTLEANQPGVMVADERVLPVGDGVRNEYGPIDGKLYLRVRPGHHILKTKLAGFEQSTWEVDVFSSSHLSRSFVLHPTELAVAPPPSPGRGARYGPWMLMGLGGAMLVAGTVTGVLAVAKSNRIDDQCPNGMCPISFDLEGERSSGKGYAAATDVLLIGGALAAAGGLTWLLLERRSERANVSIGPLGATVRLEL